jgi:hypothetical protein
MSRISLRRAPATHSLLSHAREAAALIEKAAPTIRNDHEIVY